MRWIHDTNFSVPRNSDQKCKTEHCFALISIVQMSPAEVVRRPPAGAGAGFLWAAQGTIMTSYPTPARRGTYISLFWCLFNLGGVLGRLLPFGLNYHRGNDARSVNDGTFVAFRIVGAALTLLVLRPARIVRDDGTKASRVTYSSLATEFTEILGLFANWKMLLVLPAAWAATSSTRTSSTTSTACSSRSAPRASTTSSTGARRWSAPPPSATSSTSASPAAGRGGSSASPQSPCSAPASGQGGWPTSSPTAKTGRPLSS
jgi:hypothetical protein